MGKSLHALTVKKSPVIFLLSTDDLDEVMKIAKQMLVEEYLLIGILEQFDDTLRALELLLPTYFKDALKVSKEQGNLFTLF